MQKKKTTVTLNRRISHNASSEKEMQASLKRLLCSPIFAAITAAILRLVGLYGAFRLRPWVVVNPAMSGGEIIQIAHSIASGRGFGNPLGVIETGPTAWICPVYPYLVAGIFKLAGTYTVESRLTLAAINCIFAGLTIFPIYGMAKRSFGTSVGICAAWMWVILPSAWQIPVRLAWDSTLNALSFAVIFWATLAVRNQRRLWLWAGYGALWAVGALINASVLSLAPFLFGWLLWELRRQAMPWLRPLAVAAIVAILGVAPWTIRNYVVFGKIIPIRSNAGLLLWMGNHPGPPGFDASLSPYGNRHEAATYKQMGEIAYMAMKKREAATFMKAHPARTLRLALDNAWIFWFGVTDREANPWYGGSRYLSIDFLANIVVVLCGMVGMFLAFRARNPTAPIYLTVLLTFPLVYYITRPALRFRFTIEPILVVLAAYGAVWIFERVFGGEEANRVSRESAG